MIEEIICVAWLFGLGQTWIGNQVRSGRKRKSWEPHSSFDLSSSSESLRQAARRWLEQQSLLTKPLKSSSKGKRLAIVADCDRCVACSSQFCFTLAGDKVQVEKCGECKGGKNLKRIKLENAKKFGASVPPAVALKAMVKAEVPPEERPDCRQLQNQRPSLQSRRVLDFSVEDLGSLRKFVEEPPEGVRILQEHVVISESQVRIPFEVTSADSLLEDCSLTCFLMDFTFKCNKERLLIGAIGPAGLHVERNGPHVRFIPSIFMVSEAEDEDAHGLLVRLFLEKARRNGMRLTDAFLDQACFQGASKELQKSGDQIYLHRCLQHTKTNVRAESVKRCAATGQSRLRNPELLEAGRQG